MTAKAASNRRYRYRLRARARELLGWPYCAGCGASAEGFLGDCQFAHVQPTELRGRSRGWERRYLDVLRHPASYRLLCTRCHNHHDKG